MSTVNCSLFTAIALLLSACGTTNITTTTKYDESGNVSETIITESDVSDLSAYINAGDGNVTSLNGDITKFKLGYGDIGLSWFSISGGRQKAPVNSDSNSAEALEKIAEVVKSTKTSIATESLGINAEATGTTEELAELSQETEDTMTE
ncbi:MAG: hypothetical protein R3Y46_02055 [Opitutales bacterium]